MNIAEADKEIRALARRLGVKAHQVRTALESLDEEAPAPVTLSRSTQPGRVVMATAADMAPTPASEKERPVRSEKYRRLVAALPCANCSIEGHSQAAHPNTGKGMSQKASDNLCFPLCGPRPDEAGCHARFDQGAMYSKQERRALEAKWGEQTARQIRNQGKWPMGLPRPEFK
jgi:hypothetical protein